jgi:hypothetical protein
VDWDNDGNHDLLVGDGNGNVFVYRNTNNNSNPILDNGTFILYNGDDRATPVADDWNGDGKKDLLVGNLTGTIQIYINQGTDMNPAFTSYSNLQVGGVDFDLTAGLDRSSPRIVDWNGDGLKDLLIGEVSGYIYYLQNNGTNASPVFNSAEKLLLADGTPLRYISTTASSSPRSRFDITDWNNDGYPDIVVGGSDGRVMLFLTKCTDIDGDGYAVEGGTCGLIDCDDDNADINPDSYDLPGNMVDENCDGSLSCDPNADWRNHGKFVSCVAKKTNVLVKNGIITHKEGRLLKRAAAKSDVGKKKRFK